MNESLLYFGGAVKALDENGKVGGYLVRFSDGKKKDLSGEWFTAKTFLGSRDGDGVDTMFHHGQPLPVKSTLTAEAMKEVKALQDHVFPPVKTRRDAIGIFAETVLDMADEYEKAVFGLVKAGKLGWSSGAVSHLVKKSSDGQILRWPIGEASLTPSPCEPQNRAITIKGLDAIKFVSIVEGEEDEQPIPNKPSALIAKLKQLINDRVDDGHTAASILAKMSREAGFDAIGMDSVLQGALTPSNAHLKAFARVLDVSLDVLKSSARKDQLQTIKGMLHEALPTDRIPTRAEVEAAYSSVIKRVAFAASAAGMAGGQFDLDEKIEEALTETKDILKTVVLSEIKQWLESGSEDEFYPQAIIDGEASAKALASQDFDTHSKVAVFALRDLAGRLRGVHEGRMKAGRVLSEKNRQRIADLQGQLMAVHGDLQNLLDASMPMANDSEKRAAMTKHLMLKIRHRELLGV